MLKYVDNRPFATGFLTYMYCPAQPEDTTPRINLQVQIGNQPSSAFLDTGSPYVICDPRIAEVLDLSPEEAISNDIISFRQNRIIGKIYRLPVSLIAEEGDNLLVDATVFVPELAAYQDWGEFPSIIGLNGFLERIRFAIDPTQDRFYFGDIN